MTSAGQRVLITGAGGQLASAITTYAGEAHEVLALNHADLDITDTPAVVERVRAFQPALIVNCAAYNHVDAAQTNAATAIAVNGLAPRGLARAAALSGASLLHFSTDFVFDGLADRPYTETDQTNPQSVYGASKLMGEWFVLEYSRGFVCRVASLFGGRPAKSSVDRIVDALLDGVRARAFTDRVASPSYVEDVAAASMTIAEHGAPGLYHCTGTGSCVWRDLALEAARLIGCSADLVVPIASATLELPARRPQYAALSNTKASRVVPIPSWDDALARYIARRMSERFAH